MTNLTPLSLAAQAIMDAVCATTEPDCSTEHLVAAALRAAADQASKAVQPHPAYTEPQLWAFFCGAGRMADQFRAIAAELEGAR